MTELERKELKKCVFCGKLCKPQNWGPLLLSTGGEGSYHMDCKYPSGIGDMSIVCSIPIPYADLGFEEIKIIEGRR